MNADLRHRELTDSILSVFYQVYNEMGFGFLESIYREARSIALNERGLGVERESVLTAHFRGRRIGEFRADLVVGGRVIVELKAVRAIGTSHLAQLLNYLRCSVLEVGLLLNFGPRPQFRRLAFSNLRKLTGCPPQPLPPAPGPNPR
ncbi:MAG: GxxExxY protein [Gemmatimonadales bacterium]